MEGKKRQQLIVTKTRVESTSKGGVSFQKEGESTSEEGKSAKQRAERGGGWGDD